MTTEEMLKEIDEHGEGLTRWEVQLIDRLMRKIPIPGARDSVSKLYVGFSVWEKTKVKEIFETRVSEEWR